MEVSITQFRRELFSLVNQAMEGTELYVTHKGQRFHIVPDRPPVNKLSRITPMEIVNPYAPDLNDPAFKAEMLAEMEKAWESDWESL